MQTKEWRGQQKTTQAPCEPRRQEEETSFQQQLHDERVNFQQQLQAMEARYQQQLSEERANFQQQLQAMEARYQQQLSEERANSQQQLQAIEARYQQQLHEAKAKIGELEGRLSKDSHNSSKPPSSDGPWRKRYSQRKPTGRASGGQGGHAGVTLPMSEQPDSTKRHRPDHCEHCQAQLEGVAGQVVERRQVWDLPEIRVQVEEHQIEEVSCPQCQNISRGTFPEEVRAPVQYGPRVAAMGIYFNQYHLVPMERTCDILEQAFSCPVSEGTLGKWIQQASTGLVNWMERLREELLAASLKHVDETSMSVHGKLHWMHVNSTKWLTHFAWHRQQGRVAMDAIGILPLYHGRIMRDRLSSYDHYDCDQSICGAHLLRDLTRIWERFKHKWARAMHRVLVAMNHLAWSWRSLGATCVPKEIRDRWVARYFRILALGYAAQPPPVPRPPGKRGKQAQTESKNLLDALLHRAHQVLAFLDDLRIPFTNNQAESDLRMVKVQQKISGTFRSQDGITAFARIRSYLSTMRKQGRPLLEALFALFTGHPFPIARPT